MSPADTNGTINDLGQGRHWPQSHIFSCSTQLSTIFQLLIETKIPTNKKFLVLRLSNFVFITLINVKMPTIVGIFNIYEQGKFSVQLS